VGMIDISDKKVVKRTATAQGRLFLDEKTIDIIKTNKVKKGDVLQVAEIATINAVKKTPELIPHCHQIPVEEVEVAYEITNHILAKVSVKTTAKTGVEMEALVGVTVCLNTIWDMVKYLEKTDGQYPRTKIGDVRVIKKIKGDKIG